MVNNPTHISGSLIFLTCIKKVLMKIFFTNVTVENIYFSDHDAITNVTEKNSANFQINS